MDYLGYHLQSRAFLAPMAGISDRPFRRLCRTLGAGLTPAEMVSSHALLRQSPKTLRRVDHQDEPSPRVVQIAGADPQWMAEAARCNVDSGAADIIDINMGCPAKKVCNAQAGSALLRDEGLVQKILTAVVGAVPGIPVTLKIRTGWDRRSRNALNIARIAEDCGIRALAIHGRTRADLFQGEAEYDTIAAVKSRVSLPVIANGDFTDGPKAAEVLRQTGADGVMIGRASRGNPWLFQQVRHFLHSGQHLPAPGPTQMLQDIRAHLLDLHGFYGPRVGVQMARKHLAWYIRGLPGAPAFRRDIILAATGAEQLARLEGFFAGILSAPWAVAA